MVRNTLLNKAKAAKKDEFYTQPEDIEKELCYYEAFFKDKTVFCNCDDSYESNFFKYFVMNFKRLGLRGLISTSYAQSSIVPSLQAGVLFDGAKSYCIRITEIDGLSDVDGLLRNKKNTITALKGDEEFPAGDFRSKECVELLEEADIVVTNPPFSLFREYVAQLVEHGKKFVIIGNQNAITYKEIFPLLMGNKMWLGVSIHNGGRMFRIPENCLLEEATTNKVDERGRKYIRVKGVCWFTNLDHKKHPGPLGLERRYDPAKYPKYDDYDAIEVGKTVDIPKDYFGVMGVPITFMDKYCPEQFELLGTSRYHDGQDFSDDINFINGKALYTRLLIRRRRAGQGQTTQVRA